ncbi:hypothetical protein [Enterococcus hermanniensis]|uniref:Uncharacterized protein n=1 Tax=Enterococcus hermanniensis TaxID=249189 RepID=A0A1L8TQ66_9ENTE|nr:hypothetical protein [Enterococcus hermanniensis]OJG46456.1 hypothetical protein RV04_GL000884 [Enterococcus hermanniensis]
MQKHLLILKENMTEFWHKTLEALLEYKQRTIVISISLVFITLLFSASVVFAQKTIRQDQLNGLVFNSVKSDYLLPLNYNELDKKIQSTKAVSIMFSQPRGTSYKKVLSLLEDPNQKSMLNRKFYFYPIVYDEKLIAQKYKIDPDKVTFIFFQKGKEKNRFVVESLNDVNHEFVPELNRLPMWQLNQPSN